MNTTEQTTVAIHRILGYCAVGLALLCVSACERTVVIKGKAVDVRDVSLPNVAVTVDGTEYQAKTSGVGEYALRCVPGPVTLTFIKTGYTPGLLEMPGGIPGQGYRIQRLQANDVVLWPLPAGQGVFVFDMATARYRETSRMEPKPFLGKDVGPVYGTRIRPDLRLDDPEPFLVCHKLPPYDMRLCKLHRIEASLPQADLNAEAFTERVWVPELELPIVAVPIDEPGQMLLELRPMAPLEPGVYGLHWGAFDGHFTTDKRVFLFRILEPDAEAKGEGEQEAEPEAETEEEKPPAEQAA